MNGLQATRQILKAHPGAKILILSAHSDPEYIEQVVKSGAAGYLVKQTSAELVTKAIREVHQGPLHFFEFDRPASQERIPESPGRRPLP